MLVSNYNPESIATALAGTRLLISRETGRRIPLYVYRVYQELVRRGMVERNMLKRVHCIIEVSL